MLPLANFRFYNDNVNDSLKTFTNLTAPPKKTDTPVQTAGSIAYDVPTKTLQVSDGLVWKNTSEDATSVGTGDSIVADGALLEFKSLKAGTNITLVASPTDITINAGISSISGSATTVGNVSAPLITVSLPDKSANAMVFIITGVNTTTNDTVYYFINTGFTRVGGSITQSPFIDLSAHPQQTGTSITYTLAAPNATINVVGAVGQTIDWFGNATLTQVIY